MSVMYKTYIAIRMNFYSNAKHHTCTAVCACAVLHLNQGEASHRKYRTLFLMIIVKYITKCVYAQYS